MAGTHAAGPIETWALGASWLHRREARAKILAAFALLIALSVIPGVQSAGLAILAWILVVAAATAGLPIFAVATRAAMVLPLAGMFALFAWLGGDAARAQALVAKSYISAWVVVLLMGSTPLSALLGGLARLGVPALVVNVVQMLVRYLQVLRDRAAAMRRAAASRGGAWSAFGMGRRAHRSAGAGMFASLFADAMARSERIHSAMLARGYRGRFPAFQRRAWSAADSALLAGAASAALTAGWLA